MSRDIKFRAWDKHDKRWLEGYYFISGPGLNPTSIEIVGVSSGLDEAEISLDIDLMQHTGIKDKNGVEIYEGDIVIAWSQGLSGRFEVRWRQEGAPTWILYPAWNNKQFWNLHGARQADGSYRDDVEVIGNIYENPELLRK